MTDETDPLAEAKSLGMERLLFFSDAVFAIAITLLALELRLPDEISTFDDDALQDVLQEQAPEYLAFVVSFLVVGVFWQGHHRKFRFITRYDGTLMRINLLLLMAVAFVPFTTSVISRSQSRTAIQLYAATMIAVGLLSVLLSWYAFRTGEMVASAMSPRDRRQMLWDPFKTVSVFAFSMVVAFWDPVYAQWSWLLLIPAALTAKVADTRAAVSREST